MKVTAKDIAAIVGVSRGTVDRALNDRGGISIRTKEKILRVSDELGYRPHLLARSLVKGKTMTLGLILFDFDHRFFTQMATSIILHTKKEGYFTYLTLTEKNKHEEMRCLEKIAGLQVDGIILCPINKGQDFNRFLSSLHIPIVAIGNSISAKFPFVGITDEKAIYDAVKHIAEKGYQHVVYLSPPVAQSDGINNYGPLQRLSGYRQAMKDYFPTQKPTVIKEKYLEAVDELDYASEKTAVLCSSDIYALRVLDHLTMKGVKIPEDIGLMGFDNIDTLQYIRPALATVDYHIGDIATNAVQCLLDSIEGKPVPSKIIIEHNIIPGETL